MQLTTVQLLPTNQASSSEPDLGESLSLLKHLPTEIVMM